MGSPLDTMTPEPQTTDQKLDRHEDRRRGGIPTVSVLKGSIAPALESARRWAGDLERPMVLVRPDRADAETLIVPWVDRLAAGHDLADAAVAWLARRLDQPTGRIGRSLRRMTDYEVARFFDSAVPMVSETGVELAARRLIELSAHSHKEFPPDLAPDLDARLDDHGRPWIRVFRALGELVPRAVLPVLIVAPDRRNLPQLEGLARLLADLAEAQPLAAIVLIIETDWFETYLDQAPESRAKALLRLGVVPVDSVGGWPTSGGWRVAGGGEEDGSESKQSGSEPIPGAGATRSEVLNPPPATHHPPPTRHPSPGDEARSAAERFLFDLLDSLPETTGLFELNATLDFHFGAGRPIEVDLLARSLKLVVEIDGYYHFQDPEDYRRDRRKDLELQKRGYLVLRILAEDVVDQLEELLDTLLSAVAFCRHQQGAR